MLLLTVACKIPLNILWFWFCIYPQDKETPLVVAAKNDKAKAVKLLLYKNAKYKAEVSHSMQVVEYIKCVW